MGLETSLETKSRDPITVSKMIMDLQLYSADILFLMDLDLTLFHLFIPWKPLNRASVFRANRLFE